MSIKIIGAIFIVAACGGFGFQIASTYLRGLDYMECDLQYRLTPLPDLCRQAASQCNGSISRLLMNLSAELDEQISPNVSSCMAAVLSKGETLPQYIYDLLMMLGNSMGRFDLAGQLKGLDGVRGECRRHLEALAQNKEVRLRSYKTLGLCAGAALVILFI